jgi:hypothetical protein
MARTRGMTMGTAGENDDIPLRDSGDDAARTEDDLTEDEILTELHKTEDDNSYVLHVSRILGPSRNGIGEPQLAKGDARIMMPTIYETLRGFTKPGEVGNYRLRITKNGRFWRKFDVAVERAAEDTKPVVQERNSDVASMLAAFQQSQDRMLHMIEQRLNAATPQALAFDPFASLEKLTTIIKNIMPATPTAPPTNNAKELFEAFKSGIDAVASVGGSDKETGIMDVVQSLLNSPVVARAIEMTMAGSAQNPLPIPSRPAIPQQPQQPQPASPAQATPQQPQPAQQSSLPKMSTQQILTMMAQNPALQAQAKGACDYLVSLAQRGGDTDTYGFWVCDNWDRRFIELLLNQPDWFSLVCAISPEAQGFRPWFEELVAEIREVIKDTDEAARASANGHAHASAVNLDGNTGRESGSENDFEMDGEPS